MSEETQGTLHPEIERLHELYRSRNYEQVIDEAGRIIETEGNLTQTEERKEFCFGNRDEFLLYVLRQRGTLSSNVVWLNSEVFSAYMLKAKALYELGQYAAAIEVLKAAIQNNPSSVNGRFEWVENLLCMEKYSEAEALLRETMQWVMYPNDLAKLYRRFGFCFIEQKNIDAAVACLAWSLQFEKSQNAFQELAYIHQTQAQEGDTQSAAEELMAKTSPSIVVRVLHGLGLLFMFSDERRHLLLGDLSERGTEAVLLYQKHGLIRVIDEKEPPAGAV